MAGRPFRIGSWRAGRTYGTASLNLAYSPFELAARTSRITLFMRQVRFDAFLSSSRPKRKFSTLKLARSLQSCGLKA